MKRFEHVFSTNEMPDHEPTTTKIWLGVFSGCIISIILAPVLAILAISAYREFKALDYFGQMMAIFFFVILPLTAFSYYMFKRMIR